MTPAAMGGQVHGAPAGGVAGPAPRARVPWRATLGAAIVATLVRPASWAFGLAGFLAGGGLLLVAWPIVVLPTPTGLQNALGGPAITLVFGTVSPTLALLFLGGLAGTILVVVAGCWVGAWAERQGIAVALDAAQDEGLLRVPAPDLAGAPGAWRIAAVRLMALLPVLIAIGLASSPVYDAAYRQLTVPDELVTPLPIRVIREVPVPLATIVVVWLLSDAAAAVAVRRLVLDRRPVLTAWALGWVGLVRSPLRVLGTAVVGVVVLALMVAPAMLAASIGWARVREALMEGRSPLAMLGVVAMWVAVWLGGLALAGVATAFRNGSWTFLALAGRHGEGERPV